MNLAEPIGGENLTQELLTDSMTAGGVSEDSTSIWTQRVTLSDGSIPSFPGQNPQCLLCVLPGRVENHVCGCLWLC